MFTIITILPNQSKKKKPVARVKGPVEVMQWLVDNGWRPDHNGWFHNQDAEFPIDSNIWTCCGQKKPEGVFPDELLEEVEV